MNKTDSEQERRYLKLDLRAEGDAQKPMIEGDAAVFDTETTVGNWFREKIQPGAFTRVLSESPDVIGAFNHDWNFVLGRTTAGTLTLTQTEKSLRYRIDVNPADPQAMSVYEKVKRGDVTQSSFAFTVRSETWTDAPDGTTELPLREIVEIGRLFDVGPVPFAQYPEASAQARSKSESFRPAPAEPQDQAVPGGTEDPAPAGVAAETRQKARRRRLQLAERSTPHLISKEK